MVEHYTNQGVLDCMMEGNSTGALYTEAPNETSSPVLTMLPISVVN